MYFRKRLSLTKISTMGKIRIGILSMAMLALGYTAMAQDVDRTSFKAGFYAGLPMGDAKDFSSFGLGLDLGYHWGVSELIDVGVVTGFMNAFVDTDSAAGAAGFDDFQIVPVAAAFRIYPTYSFKLGADVGYGVGINEGNEGGFYWRPTMGYNLSGNTELNVSYLNVSNDGDFSMLTLGVIFLF